MTTYHLRGTDGTEVFTGTIEPPPGGGSQTVKRAYRRLSPTDIEQAGFTTFAVAVPSNANSFLVYVAACAQYVGGTTPYGGTGSGDTDIAICYGDPAVSQITVGDVLANVTTSVWEDTVPATMPLSVNATWPSAIPPQSLLNVPLNVYLNGTGLTGGDSPVDVWLWYVEHDITDLS